MKSNQKAVAVAALTAAYSAIRSARLAEGCAISGDSYLSQISAALNALGAKTPKAYILPAMSAGAVERQTNTVMKALIAALGESTRLLADSVNADEKDPETMAALAANDAALSLSGAR